MIATAGDKEKYIALCDDETETKPAVSLFFDILAGIKTPFSLNKDDKVKTLCSALRVAHKLGFKAGYTAVQSCLIPKVTGDCNDLLMVFRTAAQLDDVDLAVKVVSAMQHVQKSMRFNRPKNPSQVTVYLTDVRSWPLEVVRYIPDEYVHALGRGYDRQDGWIHGNEGINPGSAHGRGLFRRVSGCGER